MITITKSSEHYRNKTDWLDTTHHFSFANYFDANKMNFGPLRVFNDDITQPGTGFDLHQHHDMEIVTYVIEGELEHKDNKGNHGVVHPGEVQRMSAGSGIMHSEYNHSKEKPLRLLQMWVFASKKNLEPSWEQKRYAKEERKKSFYVSLPLRVQTRIQCTYIRIPTFTSRHWILARQSITSYSLEENHTCL